MHDEPSAAEIEAYVSGELDLGGQFVVETHLSRHPEQAARVMADLGAASGLKLLFAGLMPSDAAGAAPDRTLAALGKRSFWQRHGRLAGFSALGGGALVLALVALVPQRPPPYVDDAVSSHRIALLRANMKSQVETPHYDSAEIATSTRIAMPRLPADWVVTDVQLFPAEKGPALVIAVRTPAGEQLSLFAIRGRLGAPERPDAIREGPQAVAYWQRGDMSYALTGETEPAAIDATAEAIASAMS